MNKDERINALERKNEHLRKQHRKAVLAKTDAETAAFELNRVMDTVLVRIALRYGEAEIEDGKIIGYRFEVPAPKTELLDKFKVKAEHYKDGESDMLRIGIISLEDIA